MTGELTHKIAAALRLLRSSLAAVFRKPSSSCRSMPKALIIRIPVIDCWRWSFKLAASSLPLRLTCRMRLPIPRVRLSASGAIRRDSSASFQSAIKTVMSKKTSVTTSRNSSARTTDTAS